MGMQEKHVFVDFETRSEADLRKTGAWKYAADPSTYPLMLAAYFPESGRALQWLEYVHGRECPDWVRDIATDDNLTVHAHNANFEIAIWERVLVERWKWPTIPRGRWKDTAGLAAHANLPRSLDDVGRFLGIKNAKDKKGKELIRLLSIPQKAVKKVKEDGAIRKDSFTYLESKGVALFERDPDQGPVWFWNNDRRALDAFARYNERDVIAEQEVDSMVPDYSGVESKMWELDSVINERGLPIDRELCEAAIEVFEWVYDRCEADIQALTGGDIMKPSQTAKVVKWINERVRFGKSLGKEFVEWWLDENPSPETKAEQEVAAMLGIRQVYGGSAVKKYKAALDVVDHDGRARGQFLYYGAATGRWAGRGIQPHNFFRQAIPDESVFDLVKAADYQAINEYATENNTTVGNVVRSCVRGLIQAPEGSELIVSDFAGIESRVLQWLVGNTKALDVFRAGEDMYVHTAADMYGLQYGDMMGPEKVLPEHKEHRQIGKAAVLGLGYQMGSGRFLSELQKNGIDADEEFAADIVGKWRKQNPLVADYERGVWRRLERAVKAAIKSRGRNGFVARVAAYDDEQAVLRVRWEFGGFTIELPSGRKLYYPEAELYENDFGTGIRYVDGGKSMVSTYGGKLVENVVQAIARDILVNSMFLIDAADLKIIGHVHDEVIVEHELDGIEFAYNQVHEAMETVPTWAVNLPLAAETYQQRRYSK